MTASHLPRRPEPAQRLAVCEITVYLIRNPDPDGDDFRVEIDTSEEILDRQPGLFRAALAIAGVAVRERLKEFFPTVPGEAVH